MGCIVIHQFRNNPINSAKSGKYLQLCFRCVVCKYSKSFECMRCKNLKSRFGDLTFTLTTAP